ncbi:N-formylglutamate amidohydrolase [Litchfieldia alkalitelluris]|uniref:N-formylglutamate amidohydrolase n=1 Tax=Litchfieldia alkalitelluris TaxID=304268 RepID=UPI001F26C814|nr:N-formylglutamate amidohydrolase [Litchfieldia alkalitelluris]
MERKLPIVISVPHGGLMVPQPLRKKCLVTNHDILMDSDTWSQHLYHYKDDVEKYIFTNIARIVVDMNRDKQDTPPGNPDGVVKMLTVSGKQVWNSTNGRLTQSETNQLFLKYYDRYHYKLGAAAIDPKVVLGIDCHTMLDVGPATKSAHWEKRPMFCISNGGSRTGHFLGGLQVTAPAELLQKLKILIESTFSHISTDGLPLVEINNPFKGGYITRFHGTRGRIPWIQIEINRKMYLPASNLTSIHPTEVDLLRMRDIKNRLYHVFSSLVDDYPTTRKTAQ